MKLSPVRHGLVASHLVGLRAALRVWGVVALATMTLAAIAGDGLAQQLPTEPTTRRPVAEQPADDAAAESPDNAEAEDESSVADDLALVEQELTDRFRRFEDVLLRLAEITAAEDPERAALLRRAVASSKQKLVGVQFERLVELLKEDKLATALTNQGDLLGDLSALLDLLSSEDRAKKLESEQARLKAFLKEVNKLIKEQQGLYSQTERSGDSGPLAERQGALAGRTGKLAGDLKPADESNSDEDNPPEGDGENPDADKPADDKPGEGE
ncbi:MAG: hypothetical protein AB7U73_13450, partial [Pirellulales bacterium]